MICVRVFCEVKSIIKIKSIIINYYKKLLLYKGFSEFIKKKLEIKS